MGTSLQPNHLAQQTLLVHALQPIWQPALCQLIIVCAKGLQRLT